jgi:hypothetical protein
VLVKPNSEKEKARKAPFQESLSKQRMLIFAGSASFIIARIVSNKQWAIDLFLVKGMCHILIVKSECR